jgi:hypothetical protein
VRVRMGLHTGEPTIGDEGYLGMDVVRAARISSAGHGGQILLSETTRALVGNDLPSGASMRDLGSTMLKDVQHEHIYELAVDGDSAFPPLKADAPKSSGDLLADRIQRHVEEQILAGFSGKPTEGKRVVGKPVRQAASGLLILAMTILTIALIVVGIVLLVRVVF